MPARRLAERSRRCSGARPELVETCARQVAGQQPRVLCFYRSHAGGTGKRGGCSRAGAALRFFVHVIEQSVDENVRAVADAEGPVSAKETRCARAHLSPWSA
jgi:hypothetical protein